MQNADQHQFANEFRRVKACARCSRLKTKCAYESPTSTTCIRCAKGNYVCEAAKPQDRPRRVEKQSASSGPRANSENRPVGLERVPSKTQTITTAEERVNKINQLRQVVQDAQREIAQLENNQFTPPQTSGGPSPYSDTASTSSNTKKHSISRGQHIPLDADIVGLQNSDPLQLIKEHGIMDTNEFAFYYNVFLNQMTGSLTFTVDVTMSLEQSSIEQPMSTTAMIVAASVNSRLTYSDLLIRFLERLFHERIVMMGQTGIDFVKALLIMITFIHPSAEKIMTSFFWAAGLCHLMQLGGPDDVKTVLSRRGSPEEQQLAKERVRLYAAVAIFTNAMAVNSSRTYMLSMVPLTEPMLAVLTNHSSSIDKLVVHAYRMIMAGYNGIEALKQCMNTERSFADTQKTLMFYSAQMDHNMSSTELILEETPMLNQVMIMMRNLYDMQYSALYTHALNCYLFGKERADTAVLQNASFEIVTYSLRLVDRFITMCDKRAFFPKYYFFAPLHGLINLLRVQLLLWSHGRENTMVDVEEQFKRVKKAWEGMALSNHIAQNTLVMIQRIEKWCKVRLDERGPGSARNSTGDASGANSSVATDGPEISDAHTSSFEMLQKIIACVMANPEVEEEEDDRKRAARIAAAAAAAKANIANNPSASAFPAVQASSSSWSKGGEPASGGLGSTSDIAQYEQTYFPPLPDDVDELLKELFGDVIRADVI